MKVRVRRSRAAAKYQDLTPGNVYRVIGIEADWYRVMGDEGAPYLYPPEVFDVIDAKESPEWVTDFGEDGERYSYPKELGVPGFFEDYFDGDRKAAAILKGYMQRLSRRSSTRRTTPKSKRRAKRTAR